MAEWPGIPAGYKLPLVSTSTERLPDPTMDAIEQALIPAIESGVAEVGDTRFGRVQKFDRGGMVLAPVRTPTLTVGKSWPNAVVDYRVLWASEDGYTLYCTGSDNRLYKSTDGGVTYTAKGWNAKGFGGSNVFVKTAAGTLITFEVDFPLSNVIIRSTDDGQTWTQVYSDPARLALDIRPMHATAMKQDPVTGAIYWGEYQNSNTAADIRLYRSTDDGATWSTFYTWAGPASSDPNKIRHVHAVEWDHIMQRIVIMCGDDDPKAGIYRVNAAGTSVEPLVLNDMITNIYNGEFMATRCARAIGYIPFPDYIVYGGDTASNPWIMRIPRSELGKPNPLAQRVYELNSTAWFVCKASADGSRWVMSASQEAPGTRLDSAAHLYSIEDQGQTVTEVGTLSMNQPTLASIFPVGGSIHGGDTFYLGTFETDTRYSYWRCELGRGGGAMIPWAQEKPHSPMWQTISSGNVTVPAAGEVVFGATVVPKGNVRFHVREAGLRVLPAQSQSLKLTIRTAGGATVWELPASTPSHRAAQELSSAIAIATATLTAGTELHFVLRSVAGSVPLTAVAHVVFGFGPRLPS